MKKKKDIVLPLYTPVTRIRENKTLEKAMEAKLVKSLQRYLGSHQQLAPLVPYTRDGVRLFNYLFDSTTAAEKVPCPKGFVMLPVAVEPRTKRAEKVGQVVDEISRIVTLALQQSKQEQVDAAMDRLRAERRLKKS